MKTNKKGSILMITLWILAILVIFALGLGHRASINLRLVKYQRDRLKATYLAKAGINRAIAELEKDLKKDQNKPPPYDGLDETWINNEGIFKKILLGKNENEFATVNYTVKQNDGYQTVYGVIDEKSKININKASKEIITALLQECDIDEIKAQELSEDILKWRGTNAVDQNTEDYYKNTLGYPCKNNDFAVIEEIIFVKGMQDIEKEKLEKLKSLITVYGDSQSVNINTASYEALLTICISTAIAPSIERSIAESVASLIQQYIRNTPFNNTSEIINNLRALRDLATKEQSLLTEIINGNNFTVQSDFFRIEAAGNVGNITKKITAVIKREPQPTKILYWHEN